MNLDMSIQIQ